MKSLICFIISVSLISPIYSQVKVKSTMELEVGGSNLFYNIGLGTHLNFENGSTFGLKLGYGYFPDIWFKQGYKSQIASCLFIFNPSKFGNGKFYFRGGTTFYFLSYNPPFYDDIPINVVEPNKTLNSFTLGLMYNVLKPNSRFLLSPGMDLIIAMRNLKQSSSIEHPVVPFPLIQFGVKLN